MSYNDNFVNHLNDIIALIKNKQISGPNLAIEKFSAYTTSILEIGSFDISVWRKDWREKIYRFGELFKKTSPQLFINILDERLRSPATVNKEVLEFIRSEIAFNFLPDNECKKQLEKLIEKFPLNPEFRHTLGHYFANEKKYLEAIQQYKLAIKIEPNNDNFISSRFHREQNYLNQLITESRYEDGIKYVEALFLENFYKPIDAHYHNAFVDFKCRLDDHIIFQNKLVKLEAEFKSKINTELESERKRIIEVLGFFSAIVAFILATVSIGKNFSFIETVYFIISLGIILILFAVTLSILFTSNKMKIFEDIKFWILLTGLIIMFIIIISTDTISTLLTNLADGN